jgi:hypothetical protein
MNSLRLRFSEVWPGCLLIAGFGAAGFTSGFMVGGSATPVVGAILPAIISAISAGVVAFFQSQIKTGEESITLESRRRQIGWVGGFMLVFFVLYFFGLYYGIQARTTYWAVGRQLLPEDIRKQVIQSDVVQAFYRLDLYHALQSQGLSDRDAADFVEKHFDPNYVLIPRQLLSGPTAQPSAGKSPSESEKLQQPLTTTSPKTNPYALLPEIKEHKSPTPNTLEGVKQ